MPAYSLNLKKIARYLFNFYLVFFVFIPISYAYDPWFTGPFFAQSGQTVPLGHAQLFLEGYNMWSDAIYDNDWSLESTPVYKTILISAMEGWI